MKTLSIDVPNKRYNSIGEMVREISSLEFKLTYYSRNPLSLLDWYQNDIRFYKDESEINRREERNDN